MTNKKRIRNSYRRQQKTPLSIVSLSEESTFQLPLSADGGIFQNLPSSKSLQTLDFIGFMVFHYIDKMCILCYDNNIENSKKEGLTGNGNNSEMFGNQKIN